MKIVRVIEGVGFAGIAVALHLAWFWQAPSGVLQGSGDGGSDQVSLTGMTPQIAAMLDAVDTVPEVQEVTPEVSAPTLPTLQPTALTPVAPPVQTLPTALPAIETPGLALPQMPPPPQNPAPPPPERTQATEAPEPPTTTEPPQPDTIAEPITPEQPSQTVTASPTPQPRPDRPQAPRQTSSPGQKQTRAAGTGGDTVEGNNGQGDTIGGTDAKTQDLLRTWFTRIAQQVQRTQGRALRSVAAQGMATVRLTVRADGVLQSVEIVASSGKAAVDREVLTAVRQAGRFSKAPNAIGPGPHSYNIPFRVGK